MKVFAAIVSLIISSVVVVQAQYLTDMYTATTNETLDGLNETKPVTPFDLNIWWIVNNPGSGSGANLGFAGGLSATTNAGKVTITDQFTLNATTNAANAVAFNNLNVYQASQFGMVSDATPCGTATMTKGSTALHVNNPVFSQSSVGKIAMVWTAGGTNEWGITNNVYIGGGVWAPQATFGTNYLCLEGTITNYIDANDVNLSVPAVTSTTATPAQSPFAIFGTDNTMMFSNLIIFAYTNTIGGVHAGGEFQFIAPGYMFAGRINDPGYNYFSNPQNQVFPNQRHHNAMFYGPDIAYNAATGDQGTFTVRFVGKGGTPTQQWSGTLPNVSNGDVAFWNCNCNPSTNGAFFTTENFTSYNFGAGDYIYYNRARVELDHIVYHAPLDTIMDGWDLRGAPNSSVQNCRIDTGYANGSYGAWVHPTYTNSVGLRLAEANNNGFLCFVNNTTIFGWEIGVTPGEHYTFVGDGIMGCQVAIENTCGGNPDVFVNADVEQNNLVLDNNEITQGGYAAGYTGADKGFYITASVQNAPAASVYTNYTAYGSGQIVSDVGEGLKGSIVYDTSIEPSYAFLIYSNGFGGIGMDIRTTLNGQQEQILNKPLFANGFTMRADPSMTNTTATVWDFFPGGNEGLRLNAPQIGNTFSIQAANNNGGSRAGLKQFMQWNFGDGNTYFFSSGLTGGYQGSTWPLSLISGAKMDNIVVTNGATFLGGMSGNANNLTNLNGANIVGSLTNNTTGSAATATYSGTATNVVSGLLFSNSIHYNPLTMTNAIPALGGEVDFELPNAGGKAQLSAIAGGLTLGVSSPNSFTAGAYNPNTTGTVSNTANGTLIVSNLTSIGTISGNGGGLTNMWTVTTYCGTYLNPYSSFRTYFINGSSGGGIGSTYSGFYTAPPTTSSSDFVSNFVFTCNFPLQTGVTCQFMIITNTTGSTIYSNTLAAGMQSTNTGTSLLPLNGVTNWCLGIAPSLSMTTSTNFSWTYDKWHRNSP